MGNKTRTWLKRKKRVNLENLALARMKRYNKSQNGGNENSAAVPSTSGLPEPQSSIPTSSFPAGPESPRSDSPDFPPTPPSPGSAQQDNTNAEEKQKEPQIIPEIPITPVSGRRIVDIVHVFNKLKDISNHNIDSNCGIQYLTLLGERKNGLISEFKFECEMCDSTFYVHSDGDKENHTNLDATRAIVSSKVRLSQFNTVMKTLEVPVFAEACFHEGKPVALEEARADVVRARLAAIARMKKLKQSGDKLLDVIGEGVWQPKRPKPEAAKPKRKVTPKPPVVPKKPAGRTDPEERRQRIALLSTKDDITDPQPIEFCSIGTGPGQDSALPANILAPVLVAGSNVLPQLSILPGPIILPGASNVDPDPGPSNVGQLNEDPRDYAVIYDERQELLTIQEIKEEPT